MAVSASLDAEGVAAARFERSISEPRDLDGPTVTTTLLLNVAGVEGEIVEGGNSLRTDANFALTVEGKD